MPNAAPSTRSTNTVTLAFGLIQIPLSIYSGTDVKAGLEKHEYLALPVMGPDGKTQLTREIEHEDGTKEEVPVYEDHLIGRGLTDKETGELLSDTERTAIQKKVSTEYGPVFVEDHEIEALFTLQPDTLVVKEFQPQALFHQGHYVPKTLSYVEPQKVKTGKAKGTYSPISLKLYGTLLKAMREEGMMAVVELTTRGVPKPGVLMPDGRLWQVWHTNAIREARELPEAPLVDAEVNMMRSLVTSMSGTDPLDLSDERSALIQNFADEKAAAGDFGKSIEVASETTAPEASTDLLAMLAASIEAAKAS